VGRSGASWAGRWWCEHCGLSGLVYNKTRLVGKYI
jgi:hypothetical protein